MGHLKGTTAVCFLLSTARAFNSFSPFENLGGHELRRASTKRLDRTNPTFLLMSAGSATPEGEYDGGWSSSSEDAPPSFNNDISHPSIDEMFSIPSQIISPERQKRVEREEKNNSRFLQGDHLLELRGHIKKIEQELVVARESGFGPRIIETQKVLQEAKSMDGEYVYKSSTLNAIEAERIGHFEEAEELRKEAMEARSTLPQFNLEGLWVGKYGEHGYEMINVTYANDSLIATKVTGDKNVPKGQVTFSSNLAPTEEGIKDLSPIDLSDFASKQWGQKQLIRFPGKGQVALDDFGDNQYVDGQLIVVGEYFSFAWKPLGQIIFFGRPSPELTLKMLKQSELTDFSAGVDPENDNGVAEMRLLAQRCFDETEILIDDDIEDEISFDSTGGYFSQDGCFQ